MKSLSIFSVSCAIVCIAFLFSCVPARKYDEIKNKNLLCDTEMSKIKKDNQDLTKKAEELQATINEINKRVSGLTLDSSVMGSSLRTMTTNYDQLNKTYAELLKNYKELLSGSNSETQKVLKQLQTTQDSLLKKEDELKKLAADLNAKKISLDKLSTELQNSKADLEASKTELELKEAKLSELQSILNKKDSTVKALKNKVMEALTGYEGKGLTITQKNGKVYVSLEESLLFASGSFTVDPKGVEAIKKLAKVLETNKDINVLIEGHTDNVPYVGTGAIKDNWDLSVMRATAIVKIITSHSNIDPKRLSASGKSEYDPVDVNTSKEGRAKNRRTEIILTPKLDELFQIIEQN